MKNLNLRNHTIHMLLVCVSIALFSLSCGSSETTYTSDMAEVRLVVGAGAWQPIEGFARLDAPVPMDDIESFLITVDRILLQAEDDSAEADSSNKVVIFDAEEQPGVDNEIDLVDLDNLSDIISSSEVPPGDYAKVILEISDPRLLLVGDALAEYRTNIQLTANGRMFSSMDLLLTGGDTVNLELLVNEIHLVRKGNGDFVLTPQLRVELVPDLEL